MLSSADLTSHLTRMKIDGYTVIENAMSAELNTRIREELAPYLQGQKMGRNNFEGECSERVYALLAKSPSMAELIEHTTILQLLDELLPTAREIAGKIAEKSPAMVKLAKEALTGIEDGNLEDKYRWEQGFTLEGRVRFRGGFPILELASPQGDPLRLDETTTLWRNGHLVFALCDRCAGAHDVLMRPTPDGIEVRARSRTPLIVGGHG